MTRHLALVGPTATGKSALALEVAQRAGDVEIISLDSMQVYRGMDIGTAKPTVSERAVVPHHLVDVADPSEDWSVARTQQLARAAITDIEARGRRALLVGGTGLYVRAVVDDLALPGEDLVARAALLASTETPTAVARAYDRLRTVDPVAAARIEPNNRRRIVRALEVFESTGRPFSSFGTGFDAYTAPAIDIRIVGIWIGRAALHGRIESRFGVMRAGGLLDEVRALASAPRPLSRTAAQAIGYREVLASLNGEPSDLDTAFAEAVRRTRRFARRQRMWFRRDPRVEWMGTRGNPQELASAILATWTGSVPAPV